MKYIESPSNDAYFNMALEEYVFEFLPKSASYFMLWQNENAVVVGKYQNTAAEIDADYVKDNDITVVRRLSGGGAMYQDMGNLNFTFVVDQGDAKSLDFEAFIQPVIRALGRMGIIAQKGSRNDILIAEKKFSGNAQYNKKGRTMHHGTLLFNSNLDVIGNALRVKADKIESKGVKSVRSRVTNITDHLKGDYTLEDFKKALLTEMFGQGELDRYLLTEQDIKAIKEMREDKYATWEWNYGRSPAYNVRKYRRYPFGGVEILMDVRAGLIEQIAFSGDFFGNGDILDLCTALQGVQVRQEALQEALQDIDVSSYISGMQAEELVRGILF